MSDSYGIGCGDAFPAGLGIGVELQTILFGNRQTSSRSKIEVLSLQTTISELIAQIIARLARRTIAQGLVKDCAIQRIQVEHQVRHTTGVTIECPFWAAQVGRGSLQNKAILAFAALVGISSEVLSAVGNRRDGAARAIPKVSIFAADRSQQVVISLIALQAN